jgi:tRNA pseudouridine(38-40) synthase
MRRCRVCRCCVCVLVFIVPLLTAYLSPLQSRVSTTDLQETAANSDGAPPLTSALLKISYDGGRYTGWSDANTENITTASTELPTNRRRRRNNRFLHSRGFVRSVQGVLRTSLSNVYGNVNPDRIVIEGCSRTDKGVHARSMIALVHCLTEEVYTNWTHSNATVTERLIPGKSKPHPRNATDCSYFEVLPKNNVSALMHTLNRMFPWDVRLMDIAPMPAYHYGAFHPTLHATCKTYDYTLSFGTYHDPTTWRTTWHMAAPLDADRLRQACALLQGTHDFGAFQGAPRGATEKQKRTRQCTTCTLYSVTAMSSTSSLWFKGPSVVTIRIRGDRFLFKMVRFLVGALVAVGTGKVEMKVIKAALEQGTREFLPAIECAPAKGLVLANVDYDGVDIEWLCNDAS